MTIKRCAKYGCTRPPKKGIPVMPGVKIYVCDEHSEWAEDVKLTGRS